LIEPSREILKCHDEIVKTKTRSGIHVRIEIPMNAMAKAHDPLEEIVRKNIIAFRDQAGLSQAEAADISGVPVYNLSRYERGESRIIPATVLRLLAEAYGHRVDDFYDPDPPPPTKLDERPAIFLRSMPGTEIDPEVYAKVMRAVRDANAELRAKKKPRSEK
jgi:transcriptional regulator with XRE-family HTH domain